MVKTTSHATLWAVAASFVFFLIILGVVRFGPAAERMMFGGMLTDIQALKVSSTDSHFEMMMSGLKSRTCLIQSASADVFRDGKWIRGEARMVNLEGGTIELREQRISSGDRFIRRIQVEPIGEKVRLSIQFECHPFWLSEQELLTIDSSKN